MAALQPVPATPFALLASLESHSPRLPVLPTHTHAESSYPNHSVEAGRRRGLALIMSMNEDTGGAVDRGRLEVLLKVLKFETDVVVNGSADMKACLRQVVNLPSLAADDCFVCYIGARGGIEEEDGSEYILIGGKGQEEKLYVFDDILKPIFECRYLAKKPKLLVINTCRGTGSLVTSRKAEGSDVKGSQAVSKRAGNVRHLHSVSDCLVVISTSYEDHSFRDPEEGTRFSIALMEAILKGSDAGGDVLSILTSTIGTIGKVGEVLEEKRFQCPELYTTLTRKLVWGTEQGKRKRWEGTREKLLPSSQLLALLADLESDSPALEELPSVDLWGSYFDCDCQDRPCEHRGERDGDVRLRLLTAIGKSRTLRKIQLNPLRRTGYSVTQVEALALLSGLQHNPVLRELDLFGYRGFVSTYAGVRALTAVIRNSYRTLDFLGVQYTGLSAQELGDIAAALLSYGTSVSRLFLCGNRIGNAVGARHLANILRSSPTLDNLWISNIGLDWEGSAVIGHALKTPTLTGSLRIGSDGVPSFILPLLKALEWNPPAFNSPITLLVLECPRGQEDVNQEDVEKMLGETLARVLRTNRTLDALCVASFYITRGLEALRENSSITKLQVHHTWDSDDADMDPMLITILEDCEAVQELHLRFRKPFGACEFTKVFFRALGTNRSIRTLVLDGWDGLDDDMFQDLMTSLGPNSNNVVENISIKGTSWESEGKGHQIQNALIKNIAGRRSGAGWKGSSATLPRVPMLTMATAAGADVNTETVSKKVETGSKAGETVLCMSERNPDLIDMLFDHNMDIDEDDTKTDGKDDKVRPKAKWAKKTKKGDDDDDGDGSNDKVRGDDEVRPDIAIEGFCDNSRNGFCGKRVLCLIRKERSDHGTCEIHFFFYHVEGMACLLGLGLPYAKVVVQDNPRKVHTIEENEEIWNARWTKRYMDLFTPIIFGRSGTSYVEQDAEYHTAEAAAEQFGIGIVKSRIQAVTYEMAHLVSGDQGTCPLLALSENFFERQLEDNQMKASDDIQVCDSDDGLHEEGSITYAGEGQSLKPVASGSDGNSNMPMGSAYGGGGQLSRTTASIGSACRVSTSKNDLSSSSSVEESVQGPSTVSRVVEDIKGRSFQIDVYLKNRFDLVELSDEGLQQPIDLQSTSTMHDAHVALLKKWYMQTVMTVIFRQEGDARSIETRIKVTYQLNSDQRTYDSLDFFGWYHNHMAIRFECDDEEQCWLEEQTIRSPQDMCEKRLISSNNRSQGSSFQDNITYNGMVTGFLNLMQLGVSYGGTHQVQSSEGEAHGDEMSINVFYLKGTGITARKVSTGHALHCQAKAQNVPEDSMWTNEGWYSALHAGILTSTELEVGGRWSVFNDTAGIPVKTWKLEVERYLYRHTKSNGPRCQELRQTVGREFLINHTFTLENETITGTKWRMWERTAPRPDLLDSNIC